MNYTKNGEIVSKLGVSKPGKITGGILYKAPHPKIDNQTIDVYEGWVHNEAFPTNFVIVQTGSAIRAIVEEEFDYELVQPEKPKTPEELRAERFHPQPVEEMKINRIGRAVIQGTLPADQVQVTLRTSDTSDLG